MQIGPNQGDQLGLDRSDNRPEPDGAKHSRERFRLIRERIDSGYYDRPAIVDQTVEKLIDEMLENIRQFYK